MTFTRREMMLAAGATAATAALPAMAQASGDAAAAALLDTIAEAELADSPGEATSLGIDTGARAGLKSKLEDRSPAGQQARAAHLRAHLAKLKSLNGATLSPAVAINVDTVATAFENALAGFAQPYGDVAVGGWRNTPYVVIQNVGAYLDTPRFLDTSHTIENAADAEAYLARLNLYPDQLDGETERLRAATAKGAIPSDVLLDKALRAHVIAKSGDPASWGVVTSIANRTKAIPGDWNARAAKIAKERILPALLRQEEALKAQRALAKSDAGVWHLPDGEAYYAWALAAGTTTRMTPDEVHAMGQEQVKTLQAQMDPILRAQGFTQGSVGARMIALGKDPRYLFPDDDTGRVQIMGLLNRRVAEIRTLMPRAFKTLVRGNVEVKRLPPEEEPGAPGAYGGRGSIDGKVPGRFWINLRTTALHNRYSLPTLAYHESIPGHVWQGEYSFKQPLVRSLLSFNPYSEGWALYAEQMADELGVYAGDPIGRLGYLQSICFRACRLVVDTGLHAKRWTRAQAIQWFVETNGSGVEEVTSEVDRYCSWPGQACGYKVGHSEINRLRDVAKNTMGAKFDLRSFNDALVLGGNVPMTVLERVVKRYASGTA